MNQTPFSFLVFMFLELLMFLFSNRTLAQSANDEYIVQDGFYISRATGTALPCDTIVKQGILSDGTHFFVYPIPVLSQGTMTIQRAARGIEQAWIVAGNVNVSYVIDSFEAIVKNPSVSNAIPLYTDANVFCMNKCIEAGRIDLRYKVKPYVPEELMHSSYVVIHELSVNLLATIVNNYFVMLRRNGELPSSVIDVQCIRTELLSGEDVENLCVHIESEKGMENEAREETMKCLSDFAKAGVPEVMLNLAKNISIEQAVYLQKAMMDDNDGDMVLQHAHIKRIADAFVLDRPIFNPQEEAKCLASNLILLDSEYITEMLRKTILK